MSAYTLNDVDNCVYNGSLVVQASFFSKQTRQEVHKNGVFGLELHAQLTNVLET